MDALKNITGAGSDKHKAEETKPGFVDSTKLTGGAAHTNVVDKSEKPKTTVTGAATNVVETAKQYVKPAAKPAAQPPAEAKKKESGTVIGDAATKVGAVFKK